METKENTVNNLEKEIKHLKKLHTISYWGSIAVALFVLILSLQYTNKQFDFLQSEIKYLVEINTHLLEENIKIIEAFEITSNVQYQHLHLHHQH